MSSWVFILKKNKIQATVRATTGSSLQIMRAGVLVSRLVYEFAPHNNSFNRSANSVAFMRET
jgi:hypothetical protein